jgi:hypothetical protein
LNLPLKLNCFSGTRGKVVFNAIRENPQTLLAPSLFFGRSHQIEVLQLASLNQSINGGYAT